LEISRLEYKDISVKNQEGNWERTLRIYKKAALFIKGVVLGRI
jgi:hypothetical protein